MAGNTRNEILTAGAAIAATLTGKNRGDASAAVTAALAYAGNDTNLLQAIETAAEVSVTYRGNDDNRLLAVVAAVDALSTLP